VGGEPLLAVSLWDGVLLSRAACEPVEHEPLALPGWGGRGRGASEADDRGGIAYGGHQAQRAEAGQRRHHGAGEAHPLSDGPQALRPDARKARYGGPKGRRRAPAVIRAGWQAPARPAEPLRPRQAMETGASLCTRRLRTILGRVIRDIERKLPDPGEETGDLLALARRLHVQERHDKGKLYSVHAPEVECISKGKAHKRYEFGCKVALAVSSKGGWVLAARALEGNPYDGHTLQSTMDRIVTTSGIEPEHVYCDMSYLGHDYEGECEIHVGRRRRGSIPKTLWRWMKRRAAIEPSIGHLKEERRMERCRLKGAEGDKINAVLSAAGMNFSKLLVALGASWSFLLERFVALFAPRSPRGTIAASTG
jgi:hypothetical protein